jgi:hypothetical protein
MRALAIAVCTLALAGLARGKSAVVEVLIVEPSFQHVRILTLCNGRPLDNTKIEVFSQDEKRRLSLSTNKQGVAKFMLSPPGRYRIAADAAGGIGADLILAVSMGKGKNESSFTLNLAVRPPLPPTLEDKIVAAETAGGTQLRQFQGIVVDPAGATIAQTKIDIFKKGSRGTVRSGQAESDAEGHFSATLPEGFYTAVFGIPGFSTHIVVFEITRDADPANAHSLRVSLQLAPST